VKYACIRIHRHHFPLTLMCRLLRVSRSGFYAAERRSPSARGQRNQSLRSIIGAIHETSRATYGSPRIHRELRAAGRPIGHNRVARLMREAGLRAKPSRRYRPTTTDSKHGYGVTENVLRRRFGVKETGGINRAWCGDITYIRTREGWLYLAVLLDLGSRMVVGWSMRDSLEADLSLDALRMALARRAPGKGLLHHSDRGVQYAAIDYRELLAVHQIASSMSRRANCYDNAVAESFFATLRWELLDRHEWPTRVAARSAIFDYIEVWYNRERRHSSLDYLSPLQYEQRLLSSAA
jgi:putative transposase